MPGHKNKRTTLKNHHTVYTNKVIKDTQWIKFSERVEEELTYHKDKLDTGSIDQQWIVIKRALRVSASKCLPNKKVTTNDRNSSNFISSNDKSHRTLSEYRKLFNRGRSFFLHQRHGSSDSNRNLECNIIEAWEKVKASSDEELPNIPWNKSIDTIKKWLTYVKMRYHSFRKVCSKLLENRKQKEIKKAIEKRMNDFKEN